MPSITHTCQGFSATLLRNAKGGKLTREAEGYLAGVAGEYLAERLALEGLVVVRLTS